MSRISRPSKASDIDGVLRALRDANDLAAARRLVMARWSVIDNEIQEMSAARREAMEATPHEFVCGTSHVRHIEAIARPMRSVLTSAAAWPELGLELLREEALRRFHPLLIGRLAEHPEQRPAMIALALREHRGDSELVHLFIDGATRRREPALLHAAAALQTEPGGYDTSAIVRGFAVIGDIATGARMALEAVAVRGNTAPLLGLLSQTKCPLPAGALASLAGLPDARQRVRAATDLRLAGYAADADKLEAMLIETGSPLLRTFGGATLLAKSNPRRALALAGKLVPRNLKSDMSFTFDAELTKFLRAVPIEDADMARQVLGLAQAIRAHPIRSEIEARAWPYLGL